MEYTLAIDQGTHASRALVLDSTGQTVSRSLRPVSLLRTGANHVEQDAEQIVQSVQDAIDASLHALAPQQRTGLGACGITTQRSTVAAWRQNGSPLSPAINWQDTRGAPQLDALHSRAAAIQNISGLPLSAHYGASKLHWLHQLHAGHPDVLLGPLATLLLYRLIEGHPYAVDHSNAQRMQLFDVRSLNWSHDLTDWFGIPVDVLPSCQPVCHEYGSLDNYGIPVTAVCGDQNAAWFGSGVPAEGSALVNLGSGAFILTRQTADVSDPGLLRSIAYSDQQGCDYLLEGTVNGAGNALQWLKEQKQVQDIRTRLPHWLEQVTDPPLFMNSVGGLGSPWWRRDLQPRFLQDSAHMSDAELAVAVAESVLFLVQYNLDYMQSHQRLTQLRVSGGLSRIDPLCQKLANLSGFSVERASDPEASARGVAWLAAGRPGSWVPDADVQYFEPATDKGLRRRYRLFIEQLEQYIEASANE